MKKVEMENVWAQSLLFLNSKKNSMKITAGESTFHVCNTGHWKRETGNYKKKLGLPSSSVSGSGSRVLGTAS
jgi:hypothetical protein